MTTGVLQFARLGTKHHNAALNVEQVADIRAARARSVAIQLEVIALREKFQAEMAVLRAEQERLSIKALACKHNVGTTIISDVAAYRSYAFD